jgi:CBS domain-containing protein
MNVGEICTHPPITAGRDTSLVEAAALMREHRLVDLVVVEKHGGALMPIGVISDRDLVLQVLAQEPEDLRELKVGDLLPEGLSIARADEPLGDVLKRMRHAGIRRLPVVDEAARLVGLLTAEDVLEVVSELVADVADLFAGQSRA